jgi:DDE superfamily endonuclease
MIAWRKRCLIGVRDQLAGFYAGRRVVLIWDGLSAPWSTKMRAYLDSQNHWLTAERLPAYAPDLNLVQYLWANRKDLQLANLPPLPWLRSPTQPSRASSGSASARTSSSGSSPTPDSLSTMIRQRHPRDSRRSLSTSCKDVASSVTPRRAVSAVAAERSRLQAWPLVEMLCYAVWSATLR